MRATLCLVTLAVCGCGDWNSQGREIELNGSVKVGGKVLPEGAIQFTSLGGRGLSAGAEVSDGKFKSFLPAGEYRVGVEPPPGASANAIPPLYRGPESPLRITVTSAGRNQFDLEIPADK